jgi:hypothetical protein
MAISKLLNKENETTLLPIYIAFLLCWRTSFLDGERRVFDMTGILNSRTGAAAPLPSRVSASLRSIPPLSLRSGQALDCIHPAGNKARIGLSPKALLLIFLFLCTSLSEVEQVPELPLCFFGLAGAPLV